MMASEKEIFGCTGPTYLTTIDWHNSHHRTSIAASLVKGVYVLELDRKMNRQGPHAVAPPWWEFFGFRLIHLMVDDHDLSYFGAIYEFNNSPHPYHNYVGQRPPQYVIAFRGTINKTGNRAQDLKLDFHCIINNLQDSRRFQIGMESTRNIVSRVGPGNIWLAGHSLGSSVALLIGRLMVKNEGVHIESYLFNPPFISPPLEKIKNETVKFGLRLANSVLTAGIAAAVNGGSSSKTREHDSFIAISSWIPYLFVNPSDHICSEYIGYFEHREKMERFGYNKIAKLATKHSIGSIVSGVNGKSYEAVHLIPTAYLTINCGPNKDFKDAHGIHQWWRPNIECMKYKLYQYK